MLIKQTESQYSPQVRETRQHLSVTESAVAGSVAGFVSRIVIAPFDVLKIRFQLQLEPISTKVSSASTTLSSLPSSPSSSLSSSLSALRSTTTPLPKYQGMFQAIRLIAKEEGILALWKGNLTAELLYIVYGGVQFSVFHTYKSYFLNLQNGNQPLDKRAIELSPLYSFIGGALSSSTATVVSYPLDVLRTRFVSQGEPKIYNSIVGAFSSIVKREGVFSLYKGLTASLFQIIPNMGLQFGFYESSKHLLRTMIDGENPSTVYLTHTQVLVCGVFSGITSKLCVLPLDTVKKRLQVQGFQHTRTNFGRQQTYSNVRDCFKKIITEEGVRGLFKGAVPSIVKAGPATAITFTVYEFMCTKLAEYKLK